jgi:hypothetical protein
MQELTFVGLSEDGSRLLLALSDGRRFALPIDERLRAATRGSARPGQMTIPTEAGRPRDVQARLRAGATAEEVAESSGWPLSRVEAFAVPVMQERSYVAQRARASMIRYQDGELPLEEVVGHRLAERAVDTSDFRWDAWRGEDGRWTVLLAYPAGRGDQVATWVFDLESRTLQPMDEEAAWLTEFHQEAADEPADAGADPSGDAAPTAQVVSLAAKDRGSDPEGSRHPAFRKQQGASAAPADEESAESGAEDDAAAPDRPRSGKRATVPSWDEILFGGSGGTGESDERPTD